MLNLWSQHFSYRARLLPLAVELFIFAAVDDLVEDFGLEFIYELRRQIFVRWNE